MIAAGFKRSAPEIWHAHSHHITGDEWWCTDNQGRGIITTAGMGSAPTPPDLLLMGLGACAGNGIRFNIEKRGKKVRSLDVDVSGEWTSKPCRHMFDIKMKVTADTDMDQATLAKLVEEVKEKMCPVAGTLLNTPKITTEVVVK